MLRLFVAISILFPTAAFAENTVPFPDYPDPTSDCRHMAGDGEQLTPGGPKSHIDGDACIADAQHNYNFAKTIWPRLTQHSAEDCADRASASDVRRSPYAQWMALAVCSSQLYSTQPMPPQVFTK
jgi:hypothetical protein